MEPSTINILLVFLGVLSYSFFQIRSKLTLKGFLFIIGFSLIPFVILFVPSLFMKENPFHSKSIVIFIYIVIFIFFIYYRFKNELLPLISESLVAIYLLVLWLSIYVYYGLGSLSYRVLGFLIILSMWYLYELILDKERVHRGYKVIIYSTYLILTVILGVISVKESVISSSMLSNVSSVSVYISFYTLGVYLMLFMVVLLTLIFLWPMTKYHGRSFKNIMRTSFDTSPDIVELISKKYGGTSGNRKRALQVLIGILFLFGINSYYSLIDFSLFMQWIMILAPLVLAKKT